MYLSSFWQAAAAMSLAVSWLVLLLAVTCVAAPRMRLEGAE